MPRGTRIGVEADFSTEQPPAAVAPLPDRSNDAALGAHGDGHGDQYGSADSPPRSARSGDRSSAEKKRRQMEREMLRKKKEERRERAAKKKLKEAASSAAHAHSKAQEPPVAEPSAEPPTGAVASAAAHAMETEQVFLVRDEVMREKVGDDRSTKTDVAHEDEAHWSSHPIEPVRDVAVAYHDPRDQLPSSKENNDAHESPAKEKAQSRATSSNVGRMDGAETIGDARSNEIVRDVPTVSTCSTLVLDEPVYTTTPPLVEKSAKKKESRKRRSVHRTRTPEDAAKLIQKLAKKRLLKRTLNKCASFLRHSSKVLAEEVLVPDQKSPGIDDLDKAITRDNSINIQGIINDAPKMEREIEPLVVDSLGCVETLSTRNAKKAEQRSTKARKKQIAPSPHDESAPTERQEPEHAQLRAILQQEVAKQKRKTPKLRATAEKAHHKIVRRGSSSSFSSYSSSSESSQSSSPPGSPTASLASASDRSSSDSATEAHEHRRSPKSESRRKSSKRRPKSHSHSSSERNIDSSGPSTVLVPSISIAPSTELAAEVACESITPPETIREYNPDHVRQIIRIQAFLRGVQGRMLAAQRRAEFDQEIHDEALEEMQNEACTRIQAVIKCYLLRKQVSFAITSAMIARRKRLDTTEVLSEDSPTTGSVAVSSDAAAEAVAEWPSEFNLETVDEWDDLNNPSTTEGDTITHTHFLSKGKLRVFCGTWNMHAKKPQDDLRLWIPVNKYHIVSVGTEECVNSIVKSVVFTSKKQWEDMLKDTLGPDYVQVASHSLTAIHNTVFVHESVFPLVRNVHSDAVATGLGNQLGNKGGVGIAFCVGDTSFAFVNCHFDAHQHNTEKRNSNFHRINQELRLFPGGKVPTTPAEATSVRPRGSVTSSDSAASPPPNIKKQRVSECFDRVFWFGDLNYRINGTRKMIDRLLLHNLHSVLWFNDQLRIEMERGNVFRHFCEGPLHFRPTYKFDKHSNVYDTSVKQRIPSWTDRILYLSNEKPKDIEILSYRSEMSFQSSDHRPVAAVYQVSFHSQYTHAAAGGAKDFSRVLAKGFRASQTKSEVCILQ